MKQSRRESGKIAVNYVIEKLKERDYNVTGIKGTSLSVSSPKGKVFGLKVTSLSKQNAWIIPRTDDQNIYFVLVYKPEYDSPDFFILSHDEVVKEIEHRLSSINKSISEYSNPGLEKRGLNFTQAFPYDNKWGSLPQ
jgi:hypothetical protein